MAELLLKDTQIKKALPKETIYYLNDGGGLRLKISPNGSKIWVYRFTFGGKAKETTFQSYPSVTLIEAREKRDNYRKLINQGIDPIELKKENDLKIKLEKSSNFEDVMNEWFKIEENKIASSTYKTKRGIFDRYVLPHLKDKKINTITKADLLKVVKAKEKTAPETAKRIIGYLAKLWSYAKLYDYCDNFPLADIDKSDVVIKKHIKQSYEKITDEEILKELVNKTEEYNGFTSTRNALRFVLHIPLRVSNLTGLKWKYINFENETLTIPRNEMKVKNTKLSDFTLPLTKQAINILQEQREYTQYFINSDYVFVGQDHKSPLHRETVTNALMRMGFVGDKKQTAHSYRGTFRTIAEERHEEHNIRNRILESILDHWKESTVELSYKNKISYLNEQKELLSWWSNYIEGLLNDK
ncbi:integrase arm-type DNA-binding domain-containing protein [Aliarcobacter cryaerophilus]|uniref:tyrosine-type recombinase/integrase n=1 Tax=Aliarcobacter cryaerophilus TaxID=28198 RepID=UPI0021B33DAD|nr:integrase arm-type DNA-binding domain-containing protein [Aliarcobacter cryaerophilus]MCT7505522.1 integrase arm-type DNA-binding domain-containing protein [Aliarcobacter cryaerophilus]